MTQTTQGTRARQDMAQSMNGRTIIRVNDSDDAKGCKSDQTLVRVWLKARWYESTTRMTRGDINLTKFDQRMNGRTMIWIDDSDDAKGRKASSARSWPEYDRKSNDMNRRLGWHERTQTWQDIGQSMIERMMKWIDDSDTRKGRKLDKMIERAMIWIDDSADAKGPKLDKILARVWLKERWYESTTRVTEDYPNMLIHWGWLRLIHIQVRTKLNEIHGRGKFVSTDWRCPSLAWLEKNDCGECGFGIAIENESIRVQDGKITM